MFGDCASSSGFIQVTQELFIGEVARRAGIRPSAIRYYESIGLLPEPERISGRRRYPVEIVRTLSIIGAAQRAGLSLDDVRELLVSSDANSGVSELLRAIAQRRLPEIDAVIERAASCGVGSRQRLTAAVRPSKIARCSTSSVRKGHTRVARSPILGGPFRGSSFARGSSARSRRRRCAEARSCITSRHGSLAR